MTATVITIGDELLIGQVIDTNSALIAQRLNEIGITVRRRIAVGDDKEDMLAALKEASAISEVILVTGGLGPTRDDITKQTICEFFGSRLVMDQEILKMVEALFEKLKRPMIDVNRKQAEVPDNCTPLKNFFGTAPGMWFEKEGKVFAFMPGVPFEMKPMLADQVIPKLKTRFNTPFILHRTIHTQGLGESFLAEKIKDIEDRLPDGFKLAYLPHYSVVRLRITGTGNDPDRMRAVAEELETAIREQVGEYIFGTDDTSLENEIGLLLRAKKMTLATAESITGGLIAHKITSVAGASDYFKGSIVSYVNEAKERLLGVREITLQQQGAVSEETVRQMVAGALSAFNVDYALAVSGIAGPSGGTLENPVGTAWIAAGDANEIVAKKFQFTRSREIIMEYTAITALAQLWRFITAKNN
jgi:nicotinamide-nucleotide amidase